MFHPFSNFSCYLLNSKEVKTKITPNQTTLGKRNHISAFTCLPFVPTISGQLSAFIYPTIPHSRDILSDLWIELSTFTFFSPCSLCSYTLCLPPSLFVFVLLKNTNTVWMKTQLTVSIQVLCSSSVLLPRFFPHLHASHLPFLPPSLSRSSCQEASSLKIHGGVWAASPNAFVRQSKCLKSHCL